MSENVKTRANDKLIVCLLPHGKGLDLVERLQQEKDIASANVTSGRELSHSSGSKMKWTESDVLSVAVPADKADEIFAFLYDVADIGAPHGGLIFQQPLLMTTPFELPNLQATSST